MAGPDVSIVIVNWNTRQVLVDCLKSIYDIVRGVEFETIVVDNGSSDGSTDMVRDRFGRVRLIANECNVGYAGANNQGMREARGRYVLVLNSDTLMLEGALKRTVECADGNPGGAVFGCRVLNTDGSLQPSCFMFPSVLNMFLWASYLNKVFGRSRFFARERMGWWDRSDEREVDVVTGCFMLVRREAIEEVGMMDEGYFMYAEETDWCWRFRQTGWRVMFTPAGEIVHLGGASSKRVRREMVIQLRMSVLRFLRKNRGEISYRAGCLLTAMFFGLRLPAWAVLSLVGSGRECAGERARAYLAGLGRAISAGVAF